MLKRYGSLGITLILVSGMLVTTGLAQTAQTTQRVNFAQARRQTTELMVYTNRSTVIQFDQVLARVSLAQPGVAEAVVISPTQLLLNGRTIGTSSLVVWSADDPERPASFTVRVAADIDPVVAQIAALFPSEKIKVEQVEGRVILSGSISSPEVGETVVKLFDGTGLKPVNLLSVPTVVSTTKQIMLRVRIAEINRRTLRELGANYTYLYKGNEGHAGTNTWTPPLGRFVNSPIGPDYTFSDVVNLFYFRPDIGLGTFIRALQQRNAFRSLAEPNIIAMNNEEASFLAGGEFPFAVVQPSAAGFSISIQFKEFGVRLKFKPTIVEGNRIRLHLEPEVSDLDFSRALQLAGFLVPSLRSRKASTTIEVGEGQGFALAGLLSNDRTRVDSKIPLLGDIPILGYLFRSQSYISNETELVFLCTAHLVDPVNPEDLPPIPGAEEWKKDGLEGPFGHRTPGAQPPK